MTVRHALISASLKLLGGARAGRWAPAGLKGRGAILMFHHVRPDRRRAFAANPELEVTPEFLDEVLASLSRAGFRLGTLDEAVAAIGGAGAEAPVAALTFDDGYRDFEEWALPILKRARAPAALFVTTGFADGNVAPWWIVVEEALDRLDAASFDLDGVSIAAPLKMPVEKQRLADDLMPRLRAASEAGRMAAVHALAEAAGLDLKALTQALCLDWHALAELAAEPLVTIGAHTLTHPMLAKLTEDEASREIGGSRRILAERLGVPVAHFAYPVGSALAAGPREFALVASAGFASGVTTRPGMLQPDHARALSALPRLSVNGRHQSRRQIEALLTGLPFAMRNAFGAGRQGVIRSG